MKILDSCSSFLTFTFAAIFFVILQSSRAFEADSVQRAHGSAESREGFRNWVHQVHSRARLRSEVVTTEGRAFAVEMEGNFTFVVDQRDYGDFVTLQAAIEAVVSSSAAGRVMIHIRAGRDILAEFSSSSSVQRGRGQAGSCNSSFGRHGCIRGQACELHAISQQGEFPAQKRTQAPASDISGFVFVDCKVTGSGQLYLGRAWGLFARAVFAFSYMEDGVDSRGWSNWDVEEDSDLQNIFFGQYNCFGPGSVQATRVPWAQKLSFDEAQPFLSLNFIDGEHWVNRRAAVSHIKP